MPSRTSRPPGGLRLTLFGLLSAFFGLLFLALWQLIETPQPLESALPGEANLYRWKRGHLFYKVLGAVDAPPLLLLHTPGIAASSHEWSKLLPLLAANYRVYALDLLGFGLSDRPGGAYNAETYITQIQDFLGEVIQQPALLLASGLSSSYASAVALRTPERCTRLILLDPSDTAASRRRILAKTLHQVRLDTLFYALLTTPPALRLLAHSASSSPGLERSNLKSLYATSHQFGARHAPLALLRGELDLDLSSRLDQLTQPTFIIWGASALIGRHRLKQQIQTPRQARSVVIYDADERARSEAPESLVAHLLAWQSETTAPRASSEPSNHPQTSSAQVVEDQPGKDRDRPQLEAYCVRCRKKTLVEDAREVTMKNGRPAIKGTCAECGSGIYRIGSL